MSFYCELAGEQVMKASITIPKRGIWTADITLNNAPSRPLTGKLTLILAGLSLVGTVVRGVTYQNQFSARMVGGAGGWRRTIAARSYGPSSAGLRLGPIVKDAARECGEEIRVTDDGTVGEFFVRSRDIASRVLDRTYPNWWVDETGVTRIAARPTSTVSAQFDMMNFTPALGRYDIATDSPQSFMPGARFTSPTTDAATVSLVTHLLTSEKLRTVVYA